MLIKKIKTEERTNNIDIIKNKTVHFYNLKFLKYNKVV